MRKRSAAVKSRPKDLGSVIPAPPIYSKASGVGCGESPPPAYEDALLEQLYQECLPPKRRKSGSKV